MTNLTTLLGDIQCHLAGQRLIAVRRYGKTHLRADGDRVDQLDRLIDRVHKALKQLDEKRAAA